ncbi:MAG: hypothetical protein WD250_00265 [Egibacteraceae bacterium]
MSIPLANRLNPKLLALLGAAVVVALAFVFIVKPLLFGGDEDPGALPVPASPRAEPETDDDAVEDHDDAAVAESLGSFTPRDPFRQLVTAEGGPGQGSTPVEIEDLPDGDATVALTGIVSDGDGPARAQLTVDGEAHEPAEGETFAGRFELVDIADACATLSVDGGDRVVVCEGEEARV